MVRFRVIFFFVTVLWISGLINFNLHDSSLTSDTILSVLESPKVELSYSLHIPFQQGNMLSDMVEPIVINENNSLGQKTIHFNPSCVCSPHKRSAILAKYTQTLQENQLQKNTLLFNCRLQI